MELRLGCKSWTSGSQLGFRIYASGIRDLVPYLILTSSDGQWDSLGDFYNAVVARREPPAYSRTVTIWNGDQQLGATMTIASHGQGSVQGYITAPRNSWLYDYVDARMNTDITCEYQTQTDRDLIAVPAVGDTVMTRLDREELAAKKIVRTYSRRQNYGPPPEAQMMGLYFEIKEFDHLQAELEGNNQRVYHRYPYIDSEIRVLCQNNISCDIDIMDEGTGWPRCVEVKSVSGSPGSRFQLSGRELRSREWCLDNGIPYDIVVYYHIRTEVVQRRVIPVTEHIRIEPSAYWCLPL